LRFKIEDWTYHDMMRHSTITKMYNNNNIARQFVLFKTFNKQSFYDNY